MVLGVLSGTGCYRRHQSNYPSYVFCNAVKQLQQLQQCTVPIKPYSYQSIECKYSLCAVPQCGTTGAMQCPVPQSCTVRDTVQNNIVPNEYRAESRVVRQTSTSLPVITSNFGNCAVHLCCAVPCRTPCRAAINQ